jgi:hypothetical protein
MSRILSLFDDRVGVCAVVGAAVALLLCRPLARRFASRPAVALLGMLSALLVALVTVANRGIDVSSDSLPQQLLWWTRGLDVPHGSDVLGWVFNVVLFIPVAFFATLLARRPSLVAGCLIAVSFAVETAQALFLTGRPDQLDVLANSIGSVIGAAAGGFVISYERSRNEPAIAESSP